MLCGLPVVMGTLSVERDVPVCSFVPSLCLEWRQKSDRELKTWANNSKLTRPKRVICVALVWLSSCASFVGCRGGAQPLYYSASCSVGNLCHEIIHALGLHHEHTRKDRDQYITVQWQSIMPGKRLSLSSSSCF